MLVRHIIPLATCFGVAATSATNSLVPIQSLIVFSFGWGAFGSLTGTALVGSVAALCFAGLPLLAAVSSRQPMLNAARSTSAIVWKNLIQWTFANRTQKSKVIRKSICLRRN